MQDSLHEYVKGKVTSNIKSWDVVLCKQYISKPKIDKLVYEHSEMRYGVVVEIQGNTFKVLKMTTQKPKDKKDLLYTVETTYNDKTVYVVCNRVFVCDVHFTFPSIRRNKKTNKLEFDLDDKGNFKHIDTYTVTSGIMQFGRDALKDIKSKYRQALQNKDILNEAFNSIKDNKIWDYIKDCFDIVKEMYPNLVDWKDLNWLEVDRLHNYGRFIPKEYENGVCIIELNKNMFNDDEKIVKNTILHELAHYIVFKMQLYEGLIEFDYYSDKLKWTKEYLNHIGYYRPLYSSHGKKWKEVAQEITNKTGLNITRLAKGDDLSPGITSVHDSKVKYIVKCKNCPNVVWKYTKETRFIRDILDKGNKTPDGKYLWTCRKCHKGDFEIEIVDKDSAKLNDTKEN